MTKRTPAHGGNLEQAVLQYGIPRSDWLDLSTGISPFVWPVPAIPDDVWQRLPENNGELEQAARAYFAADVLPIPGSQWAIQQLPSLFNASRVWMARESYEEYRHWWQVNGNHLTCFEQLPAANVLQSGDVVIVINPNNPTARLYSPDTLLVLAESLRQRDGWLIVDEAFMDATPESSLASHLSDHQNIIVLRSMGKFFGLAGIRVGFVAAPQNILQALQERLGPWAISHPAQWIAIQALQDTAWQTANRARLQSASLQLEAILQQHFPRHTLGRTALFASVQLADGESQHWQETLARNGIWIRQFPQWNRIRFGIADDAGLARLATTLNALPR